MDTVDSPILDKATPSSLLFKYPPTLFQAPPSLLEEEGVRKSPSSSIDGFSYFSPTQGEDLVGDDCHGNNNNEDDELVKRSSSSVLANTGKWCISFSITRAKILKRHKVHQNLKPDIRDDRSLRHGN